MIKVIQFELKKLVSRIGIYVLVLMLAGLLVAGVFMYDPIKRNNATLSLIGETVTDMYDSFNNDFKDNYKIWLKKVVRYFESYIKLNTVNKQMYHVIRIKHIIENYEKFGSFSLALSKEVVDWIDTFKKAENKKLYKDTIVEALVYLKNKGGDD